MLKVVITRDGRINPKVSILMQISEVLMLKLKISLLRCVLFTCVFVCSIIVSVEF